MVLSGIVLVFASMFLETSTKIFIGGKNAAEDSQKIQFAMNRLIKELTYAEAGTVQIHNNRSIQWTSRHPDRFNAPGSVEWSGVSGSDLNFTTTGVSGAPLLDNVSLFSVSSTPGSGGITITLKTRHGDAAAHTATIHPRYDQP